MTTPANGASIPNGIAAFDEIIVTGEPAINVGITEFNLSAIKVFPNPTSDILIVSGLNEIGGVKGMEITNLNGKVIMKNNDAKKDVNVISLRD